MAPMAYGACGVILSLAELKVEDIIVTLVATVVGGLSSYCHPPSCPIGRPMGIQVQLPKVASRHTFLLSVGFRAKA
jgi:hypothetical protein